MDDDDDQKMILEDGGIMKSKTKAIPSTSIGKNIQFFPKEKILLQEKKRYSVFIDRDKGKH